MLRVLHAGLLLLVVQAAWSCSSGSSGCPCQDGYSCQEEVKCVKQCDSPEACGEGESCIGGMCQETGKQQSYIVPATLAPLKLDVLWVTDPSTALCRGTTVVARHFPVAVEELKKQRDLDLRVAVISNKSSNNHGTFANTPATWFLPACGEYRVAPCIEDTDCEDMFGLNWVCNSYSADLLYNFNGSANSYCIFRCVDDGECCKEFCTQECGEDEACKADMCLEIPDAGCSFQCVNGGDNSICSEPPDTTDCPAELPVWLTEESIEHFKCLALVSNEPYSANLEQGMRAAWLALDPEGPNSEQSAAFLRDDAYLLYVFVSDEEDCSIDEDFCAPNYRCDSEAEEAKCDKTGGTCKLDVAYSYVRGEETRLCCGVIKKDYYGICGLLGEFKGTEHHSLAYDPTKTDCQSDEDCEDNWYCKETAGIRKCKPNVFSFPYLADYGHPPGAPIFSLMPAADVGQLLRGPKEDPTQVLVAAIAAYGRVDAEDTASFISPKCLGEEGTEKEKKLASKLDKCLLYKDAKDSDTLGCNRDLAKEGCEQFYQSKLACIEQCFVASKGNADHIQMARNTYSCATELGAWDFGGRYNKLVQMFGPNGLASNACMDHTLKSNVQDIADLLARRTVSVCLPRVPEEWETLAVTVLAADGSEQTELAPGEDFTVKSSTSSCCLPHPETGVCTGSSAGLLLNLPVIPSAQLKVDYSTDR